MNSPFNRGSRGAKEEFNPFIGRPQGPPVTGKQQQTPPEKPAVGKHRYTPRESVIAWARLYLDAGRLTSEPDRKWVSTRELYRSYVIFCERQNTHPVVEDVFGKTCSSLFGPSERRWNAGKPPRPRGYRIPRSEQSIQSVAL